MDERSRYGLDRSAGSFEPVAARAAPMVAVQLLADDADERRSTSPSFDLAPSKLHAPQARPRVWYPVPQSFGGCSMRAMCRSC